MLNPCYNRVRSTEHLPRGRCQFLERRHGLAEIVERGAIGSVERLRRVVSCSSPKIIAASNYASTLMLLQRFGEVKSLLRKTIPVARRIFGEVDSTTLRMQMGYARALFRADNAALGDILAAVETLEETTRTARRVLGGAHPVATGIEICLRDARAALRARQKVLYLKNLLAREAQSREA